jgi:hypothetical protein
MTLIKCDLCSRSYNSECRYSECLPSEYFDICLAGMYWNMCPQCTNNMWKSYGWIEEMTACFSLDACIMCLVKGVR